MQHWIADGYFFKIANYEMLARDLYAEPNKKDNRIPCAAQVLKSFEMVVFDEIHYCKHHSQTGYVSGMMSVVTRLTTVCRESFAEWDWSLSAS